MLGWAPAGTLVVDDPSGFDQFATPHAPWFGALERTFEAGHRKRALPADGLGAGRVDRTIGEEEVGQGAVAVPAAGLGPIESSRVLADVGEQIVVEFEVDGVHLGVLSCHVLVRRGAVWPVCGRVGVGGTNKKAAGE